jgi:hypothetical protein
MIVRNPTLGCLCGYVGVYTDHPWHGYRYHGPCTADNPCGKEWCDHTPESQIEVHGGITFSGKRGRAESFDENIWWFGFDCGHWRDLTPGMVSLMEKMKKETGIGGAYLAHAEHDIYRDIQYVKTQVQSLAQQLRKVGHAK